ncbi:hypothetical protein NQ314_007869 [Rhamnusium bicolor]|uniref:Chaoptin n=1 Tax=Rhamnusium bicolor TaxID=1586634 RepID=A0AAV8YIR5_9CUCU|nr:hypothetical protein NQ314_007869 [Rhamnusium bicolor]
MKLGYAMVIGTFILMIWISMIETREMESVHYPPCNFNPLCSCSKSVPDLGIVKCQYVHLPRIPEAVNTSKVFMLHLEDNGLSIIEPYFLQSTGLYKIIISRNPLSLISHEVFMGLERSLWELEISHCDLTHVPNRAIRYLQKNTAFRFNREIDPSVFRDGMGRLAHLILADNQLSAIPYQALQPLRILKTLDLSYNRINKMAPATEPGVNINLNFQLNLDTFRLDYNQLTILEPVSFQYFNIVNKTYLDGNPLSSVEPRTPNYWQSHTPNQRISRMQQPVRPQNNFHNSCMQRRPQNYPTPMDTSSGNTNLPRPSVQRPNNSQKPNFTWEELHYTDINQENNYYQNDQYPSEDKYESTTSWSHDYYDAYESNMDNFDKYENAFRQAKIRELYMRSCGLIEISPAAFGGLENYLELLDLTGNNISLLPQDVFHRFELLRTLSLRDNNVEILNPIETFNGFHFTLYKLDLSGIDNTPVSIQDLRRLRSLRTLSLSRLSQQNISPEDFLEFGIDLEELQISFAKLKTLKNNAFRYVHGLKAVDLSENSIATIENDAFTDIGHSLIRLRLSHAFSSSVANIPTDAIKVLSNLEDLDLSNNRLKNMPDTSFHFLRKLKNLKLQDNIIEGDIHSNLEEIYLSFNNIKTINQHTFVHLPKLEQLHLDDNRIENLERRSFMNLGFIKRLNLKGNKISTISYEAFQNLPELEDLDMSYNKLTSFDFSMFDQVGTLSIFSVNASHNMLTDLLVNVPLNFEPGMVYLYCAGLGRIHSNIKILDLSYNNISSISKQFFRPVELSIIHLYLAHNGILNATRDVFGSLRHLQWLDISHNGMYEMDFDMFRNTKKLQVLQASHNRIADVPNDLFRFLNDLRMVDFSHNRLRFLPDNLFREEGLERLDISHNLLSKLPLSSMSVAAAITLCELDLSWNSISSLSHGGLLSRFKNLIYLDLSYNRLAQIDGGTFKGLPRLSRLDLSHNSQLALEPNGLSFQGLEYSLLHLNLDNVSLTMAGVFCKMYSLRTLKINYYRNLKNFNIPSILQFSAGLKNLEIHVDTPIDESLEKEMSGDLPPKLHNITFTGKGLKQLGSNILQGVKSPTLHFCVRNTSILKISSDMFENVGYAKNLTVDVRDNGDMQNLFNPSSGLKPGLYKKTFLVDLKIAGNKWSCDCDLGWIEMWLRKRRQYLCGNSLSVPSSFADPEYTCRHVDDDLRTALCFNKNNNTVIDVLKTDIECGWSSSLPLRGFATGVIVSLVLLLQFV